MYELSFDDVKLCLSHVFAPLFLFFMQLENIALPHRLKILYGEGGVVGRRSPLMLSCLGTTDVAQGARGVRLAISVRFYNCQ